MWTSGFGKARAHFGGAKTTRPRGDGGANLPLKAYIPFEVLTIFTADANPMSRHRRTRFGGLSVVAPATQKNAPNLSQIAVPLPVRLRPFTSQPYGLAADLLSGWVRRVFYHHLNRGKTHERERAGKQPPNSHHQPPLLRQRRRFYRPGPGRSSDCRQSIWSKRAKGRSRLWSERRRHFELCP